MSNWDKSADPSKSQNFQTGPDGCGSRMTCASSLFQPAATNKTQGFAPGSWTQVAVDRTRPNGRVIGIDLLPAAPPKGASAIQGDFLSPQIQAIIKDYLCEPDLGRPTDEREDTVDENGMRLGYIDIERAIDRTPSPSTSSAQSAADTVDVVLSDMSEPWPPIFSFWSFTLSQPFFRLMNTSGITFRDHATSMVLFFFSSPPFLFPHLDARSQKFYYRT